MEIKELLEEFIKDRKEKIKDFNQVIIDHKDDLVIITITEGIIKDFDYQLTVLNMINNKL